MASLREYFIKDGAQNLTTHQTWTLTNTEGVNVGELTARLHLDFDANAKYVSFFIPDMPTVECPEAIVLNKLAEILKWPETQTRVLVGFGDETKDAQELVFTGQIYLYSERPVPEGLKARLITEAEVGRGMGEGSDQNGHAAAEAMLDAVASGWAQANIPKRGIYE
jgi:hypothetical protein